MIIEAYYKKEIAAMQWFQTQPQPFPQPQLEK